MPYLLHHYFDPYFDHQHLKPTQLSTGSIDHYNLGYTQNVVKDQVIAEWREISEINVGKYDPNFIFKEKKFPVGPNCRINPDNPDQLLAAANGYVFYFNEKICVKTTLNIRGNVDFNTGNIFFVNDIHVFGDVKSNFEVWGNNILVDGTVEGARINSGSSILIKGGIKGRNKAIVTAENNLRTHFCEQATVFAKGNVLVETACMHSRVYAGKYLGIKNRLVGGEVFCQHQVYIGGQVGGGMEAITSITLGYNPQYMFQVQELKVRLEELEEQITLLSTKSERDEHMNEKDLFLKLSQKKKAKRIIANKIARVWDSIDARQLSKCKIICPGPIKPGLEISIGQAYLFINDYLENIYFYYEDGEVKIDSPAR